MCDLLEWKDGPQAWQTVGFPEEDMLGMAIRERSLHGQEVKHRFEKHLKKNFQAIEYKWKKEWKARQSGVCTGEYYPHYHLMYRIPEITTDNFEKTAIKIATLWVKALHTNVEEKALRVHTYRGVWNYKRKEWSRKPAFEWLEGNNQKTISYACKYMGKAEEIALEGEETGRSWGGSRGIPKERQGWHWLTGQEEIWLARLLWRKWKRRLKGKKCRRGLRQAVAQLSIWGAETRETMGLLLVACWELAGTFKPQPIEDCPF